MNIEEASVYDLMEQLKKQLFEIEARFAIDKDAMHHMREIYSIVYGFGVYDPDNAATAAQAQRLMPHIKALNAKWGFKRQ